MKRFIKTGEFYLSVEWTNFDVPEEGESVH